MSSYVFFFNYSATPEIYTLPPHDALPISAPRAAASPQARARRGQGWRRSCRRDRKSTRLNSSHSQISYAVFCLKKKKKEDGVASGWLVVARGDLIWRTITVHVLHPRLD